MSYEECQDDKLATDTKHVPGFTTAAELCLLMDGPVSTQMRVQRAARGQRTCCVMSDKRDENCDGGCE